jgi:hypothetical protein
MGGLEGPLPCGAGKAGWCTPQKTPSSAPYLPCEIARIAQDRPILAPEFTESGQEEAGKGLKIPFCGGSALPATPFRQETAVNWLLVGYLLQTPPSRRRAFA